MSFDPDALARALTARRDALRAVHDRLDGDARRFSRSRACHLSDRAADAQLGSRLAGVGELEAAELARVEAALERLAQGTYGICAECEEGIEPRRLAARPEAEHCRACAEELDG